MAKDPAKTISSEVIAAFLDGNASAHESKEIFAAFSESDDLRELLHLSRLVDMDLGLAPPENEVLPIMAMAATCNETSYCSLECEKYILRKYNIAFDEQQMLQHSIQKGWQKRDGTALHNIGRNLEEMGLVLHRRYRASMENIAQALAEGEDVIVAVDGGELLGDREQERLEDILIGEIPDHSIVVLSYDEEREEVTIFDPNSLNDTDVYPREQFEDAWNDSKNFLITITPSSMKKYIPSPIDISDVELSEELSALSEAIAENAHDIWAAERQSQGWTYGPQRNDERKETPCMVPYSQLSESEKNMDRSMAMRTIKLMKKLGYDFIKREETETYALLLSRIHSSTKELVCPYCSTKENPTPICRYDVYCNQCGKRLDIDWSLYEK